MKFRAVESVAGVGRWLLEGPSLELVQRPVGGERLWERRWQDGSSVPGPLSWVRLQDGEEWLEPGPVDAVGLPWGMAVP